LLNTAVLAAESLSLMNNNSFKVSNKSSVLTGNFTFVQSGYSTTPLWILDISDSICLISMSVNSKKLSSTPSNGATLAFPLTSISALSSNP
jgi:hypothetical protein